MMVRFATTKHWNTKISRAFYDYGRLCAAHPKSCLSISILTIIFLSYPAISKLGLPISSPIDVYWSHVENEPSNSPSAPDWLRNRLPALYIQQIVIKGKVEPWFGNLTASAAIRASISRSFSVLNILNSTQLESGIGLNSQCFRAAKEKSELNRLLPRSSCIILAPTLFWQNNFETFEKDSDILNTIFKHPCSPSMCFRDILFGTPMRFTGIKQNFQTNRQRIIEYAITLIQLQYSTEWRKTLMKKLEESDFKIVKSHALDEQTFIHVFYKPREYISDYLPLLSSYCLCVLYFYFTVRKIEMVKCKPGLALAAFITVSTTLTTTAGIAAYFDLNIVSLWRSNIFPYLALILGLENVLCITRSVVCTPPSLDVPSRISHGLSLEGYSMTKFFISELVFLLMGFLTHISPIQEFCVFAFIGIVVDMYMQLFFYTPCLVFDLYRMDCEDKQRFSLMLFDTDIRQLKNYSNPRCPARYFVPSLFARKNRLVRTHSETGIAKKDGSTTLTYMGHRRSSSNAYNQTKSRPSNRLRFLYFWTKFRIVQRFMLILFFVWVMWLAFIVHKWRIFESISNETESRNSLWISQNFLDTAPLEFGDWQLKTFKWWPVLFAEYNFSLAGKYITFLPPIIQEATISAFDPILTIKRTDFTWDSSSTESDFAVEASGSELKIAWLLVLSALIPFTIVLIFIGYICFWDKLSTYREARRSAAMMKSDKNRETINKTGFVELTPLAFSRHEAPIECACVGDSNTIVSASVNGQLFIWDSKSGELRNSIQRTQSNRGGIFQAHNQNSTSGITRRRVDSTAANFIPNEPSPNISQIADTSQQTKAPKSLIWSLAVKKNIIAVGCSNGIVQLANTTSSRLIGTFSETNTTSGIVHIEIQVNRIIFVRLNGVLEIVEFKLTEGPFDEQSVDFTRLSASRVHKKPITKLICCTWKIITASCDHTLRIFDSRSMCISHTLNGHLLPVMSACVSQDESLLFSSCDFGRICCWNLEDGQLLRSVDQSIKRFVELACTSTLLIGFGDDGKLWQWDLKEGHAIAELSLQDQVQPLTLLLDIDEGIEQSLREPRFLAVLSDQYVVTSDSSLQIWDLQLKAIIKQVRLPGCVDSLQRLDDTSALCCSGSEMFRVSLPMSTGRQR